jgi:hypothetical protein
VKAQNGNAWCLRLWMNHICNIPQDRRVA